MLWDAVMTLWGRSCLLEAQSHQCFQGNLSLRNGIKGELNSRIIWASPDKDDLIWLWLSRAAEPEPVELWPYFLRQNGSLCTQALWLPLRQLTKSYPDVSNFNSSRFCLMMRAIYIVVILECYYAFKEREREIRPVETLSSKCFLWRALLTMSEREMRPERVSCKAARVFAMSSLKNGIYCTHLLFLYLLWWVYRDSLLRKACAYRSWGGCPQVRCDLIQYCSPKQCLLDSTEEGLLPVQMEQGLCNTPRFKNTVKGKTTSFMIICRFRGKWGQGTRRHGFKLLFQSSLQKCKQLLEEGESFLWLGT